MAYKYRAQDTGKAIEAWKKGAELASDPELALELRCLVDEWSDDFAAMLERCNQAIEEGLESATPYRLRAQAKLSLDDKQTAADDIETALERAITDLDYIRCGGLLIRVGSTEKAIQAFLTAQPKNPNNHAAYKRYGDILRDRGDIDPAIVQYKKALQLQPFFGGSNTGMMECLQQKGQLDEALEFIDKIASRNESAYKIKRRGALHYSLGHYRKALADFERAFELDPKDATTLGLDFVVGGTGGREKLDAPDLDFRTGYRRLLRKADALYSEWIETDPHSADNYRSRAAVKKVHIGLLDAMSDWAVALQLEPAHEHTAMSLSVGFAESGDYDNAIRVWEDLRKRRKNERIELNQTVRYALALLYLDRGDEEAYSKLIAHTTDLTADAFTGNRFWIYQACIASSLVPKERYLDFDPSKLTSTPATQELYKGQILYRSGKPAEAIEILSAAQLQGPLHVFRDLFLTMAYTDLEQYDQAVETFANAVVQIELMVNRTAWFHRLIFPILRRECELKLAGRETAKATSRVWAVTIKEFESAFEQDPASEDQLVILAEAYTKFERFDKAIQTYERFVAHSDPKFLAEERNRISVLEIAQSNLVLIQLRHGDVPGYTKVCEEMLSRVASASGAASVNSFEKVCWSCALSTAIDPDRYLPYCVEHLSKSEYIGKLQTYGAALYRAGEYQQAIEVLMSTMIDDPVKNTNAFKCYTSFPLAMAHSKAGQADQAKQWQTTALVCADKAFAYPASWLRRLTIELLRDECELTLNMR